MQGYLLQKDERVLHFANPGQLDLPGGRLRCEALKQFENSCPLITIIRSKPNDDELTVGARGTPLALRPVVMTNFIYRMAVSGVKP